MKRNTWFIVVFVFIFIAILVVYAGGAIAKIISEKQPEPVVGAYSQSFVKNYVLEKLSIESQTIPCFSQDSIIINNNLWSIGADAGEKNNSGYRTDAFQNIVAEFPDPLVRKTSDSIYLVYDTDSGSRLFIFFDNNFGLFSKGYWILMKQTLQSSDFASLKTNNSIKDVEIIDSVVAAYVQVFDGCTDILANSRSAEGLYFASVHLLSDGIIKIEYERVNGEYIIRNVVYSPDFVLEGIGDKANYKILKEDYIKP